MNDFKNHTGAVVFLRQKARNCAVFPKMDTKGVQGTVTFAFRRPFALQNRHFCPQFMGAAALAIETLLAYGDRALGRLAPFTPTKAG